MRFVFKPQIRPLQVVGPWISAVKAEGALAVVADGAGLADRDGDRLLEHLTRKDAMWLVTRAQAEEGLVFDLGRTAEIESLQIWNYNEPGYTVRGIAQADVSVWTADGGWKTVLRQAKLEQAEGTDDYDEPTLLTLTPTQAQKVRLENLTPFEDEGFIGLSAVRFYGKATLAACNPQPNADASLPCTGQVTLAWTPGKDAVAHDIYAAPEGEELTLLGRIAQSQVNLSGLVGGKRYSWRADQVRKDGTVTVGPEWSFRLEQGRCVGHWTFDETSGAVAADANGAVPAAVKGSPTWLAEGGRFAGAIQLNGQSDFVEVPALNLNTDVMTITAWLRAAPQKNDIPGVVLCRTNSTVSGINLRGVGLRYHWNDLSATYDWNSGLTVPTDGTWTFVALTVTPEKGTLFMFENGRLKSAENRIHHPVQAFDGPLMIGRDGGFGDRYYTGAVDDVRVFNYALGANQIAALAEGRDAGVFTPDAAPKLTLAGAELLDVKADLKAVAEAQTRAVEGAETQAPRRNFLPVLVIIAVIIVLAFVVRLNKKS